MGRPTNPPVPCPDVAPAVPPISAAAVANVTRGSGDAFTALLLIMGGVLATCFVFLTYYAVLLRQRTARRRRALRRHLRSRSTDTAASADDLDDEEGGDPHHVWYIRTEGLDEDTIKSIAVVAYKGGSGNDGSGDCTVCLSEFKDGELIRVLPKCLHGFHVPCIDTWLRTHLNCPLCRAPVVTDAVAGPPSDFGSSFPIENSTGNASHMEEEDEEEFVTAVVAPPGPSFVLDRSNTVAGGVRIGSQMDEGSQIARRTISMDCSIIGNHSLNRALEWDFQPAAVMGKEPVVLGSGTTVVIGEKKDHDPNIGSSQNNDCGPERSPSSGSSGRFFLSILGRNRNNTILPL